MAAQSTTLNRRRFNRWINNGPAAATSPATAKTGVRKNMGRMLVRVVGRSG